MDLCSAFVRGNEDLSQCPLDDNCLMQAGREAKGWRLRTDLLSQLESQMELGGSVLVSLTP